MASRKTTQDVVMYRAGAYVCPKCNNKIVVLVDMTAPPMCWNHKGTNFVEMSRKGK